MDENLKDKLKDKLKEILSDSEIKNNWIEEKEIEKEFDPDLGEDEILPENPENINLKESIEPKKEIIEIKGEDFKPPKIHVGRPKGIPASSIQKQAVAKASREYQRKLKAGLIQKESWETHGAFSYMSGKVPKNKKHLMRFIQNERDKWLEELGGEENLSSIEISMLDEACRLLLFSSMVNDFLLSSKGKDIVFQDDDGDLKMHTALSRHYLSFTKNYISILKELQRISTMKPKQKNYKKTDTASKLQELYKNND